MAVILWYKKYTETLAETLLRFKKTHTAYVDEKMTYAGRLDPLAEGLLILLTGLDVHKKEQLLGLDKTYEVSFVLGVSTDTYDVLGFSHHISNARVSQERVVSAIEQLRSIKTQTYPAYSSKTVKGKPLFVWAREGLLNMITIPTRSVHIYESLYISSQVISAAELHKQINNVVQHVKGDFRQADIIARWDQYFKLSKKMEYSVHTISVSCSSGTYVRTLVHVLGEMLGSGACSLKINRVAIGYFGVNDIGVIEHTGS